jgi:hypothetical protein
VTSIIFRAVSLKSMIIVTVNLQLQDPTPTLVGHPQIFAEPSGGLPPLMLVGVPNYARFGNGRMAFVDSSPSQINFEN